MKKIQVVALFVAGFIVGALTIGLWLGGIGRHQPATKAQETQEEAILEPDTGVASSKRVVVAYAVADANKSTTTNMIFTITEVWKGSEEGSALGITNGTQIRYQYPSTSTAYLPDAAIVAFTQDFSPSGPQAMTFGPGMSMDFVRQGKVDEMTVQQFKTKNGL